MSRSGGIVGLIDKARGRSVAELRYRSLQALTAWRERHGMGDTGEPQLAPVHGSSDAWVAGLRARGRTGFFPGVEALDATLAAAARIDAGGLTRQVAIAESALQGRFDLLGYRALSFGMPIDWHLDPVMRVRSPRGHWSTVPYLDVAVAGDHKIVWELNRHQWLVSCALAWCHTGEGRFASFVDAQLNAWMDANPPKDGINWASSLEIAFRGIAWCWVLRLLATAPELGDRTVQRAAAHLQVAARHLTRNLSTWFSPNTHLTGEALGLYYLGRELEGLQGAEEWRAEGERILLEWLPRHVRPDGTYFEQATWYHRYTADFYTHLQLLASRSGTASPAVADTVGRLGHVLAAITRPDGTMPLIGDDDGGRLLFLDDRTANDPRPAVLHAGLIAGDDALAAQGVATLESLLLFGAHAVERVRPAASVPGSRLFADGGLAVLRGHGPGAGIMVVDAGAHGAMNCGHAHADACSFDLSIGDAPVFVDPGTMAYTRDAALRDRFRATASHNAATVDGADSSVMRGPFAWHTHTHARVDRWIASPAGDLLVTSHDGFGIPYRREILRVPTSAGDVWLVRDTCHASRQAALEVHLQVAPGLDVETAAHGLTVRRVDRVVACLWSSTEDRAVLTGQVSRLYGMSEPAPHLLFRRAGRDQLDLLTVVAPCLEQVSLRHDDDGDTLLIQLPGDTLAIPLRDALDPARVSRALLSSLRST